MSRTNYLEKVAIVRFYSVPFEQMLAYTLLHVMGHNAGLADGDRWCQPNVLLSNGRACWSGIMNGGNEICPLNGGCIYNILDAFKGIGWEYMTGKYLPNIHKHFK